MSPLQAGPAYTVRLANDVELIAFARLMLRRTLPDLDAVDEPLFFGAVTEIIANAIAANQRAQREEPIELSLHLGPEPQIVVRDNGTGFDPRSPLQHPESSGEGLGLQIAHSVCPDLSIDSSPTGTTVTIPFPVAPSDG